MNAKILLAAAVMTAVIPAAALAHHGWAGQEDRVTLLEGPIQAVTYRNPHGTIDIIAADKTRWTITLAPIARMSSRGLTADKLKVGTVVKVTGNRTTEPGRRELKASKITVGGVTTDLMA
jgi:hypothetical protein